MIKTRTSIVLFGLESSFHLSTYSQNCAIYIGKRLQVRLWKSLFVSGRRRYLLNEFQVLVEFDSIIIIKVKVASDHLENANNLFKIPGGVAYNLSNA